MIDVDYWPTPNGKKVTILLEECELEYHIVQCSIGRGDQFKDDFLAISPNNRMPAIVDHKPMDGGEPITIFESGAIMMYIAEKAGQFYPQDLRGRTEVNQWLIWQMANQGPKTGECGHFRRLEDREGDQSYAVRRFTDEVNRLYGVINNRLYESPYLAGDEYTIADMITYPWTVGWKPRARTSTTSNTSNAGSRNLASGPRCSAAWQSAAISAWGWTRCPKRSSPRFESCFTTSARGR